MKDNYIFKEYQDYLKKCSSTEQNYIYNRLINQIIWYDKQAIKKQAMFKRLTIISTISTAIIPILSLIEQYDIKIISIITKILISIASTGSAVLLSILYLCEYRNLWIEYRSSCEILKSILHRYFTQTNEFKTTDNNKRFKLLVSICEEYMTKEFQTWTELSHDTSKEQ